MTNRAVVNFNSGEISPDLDALKTIEKYIGGCRRLDNMIPDIYGNAIRRPGTEFVAKTLGEYPGWPYFVDAISLIADNTRAWVLDKNLKFVAELALYDDSVGIQGIDFDEENNILVGYQPFVGESVTNPMVLYDSEYNVITNEFEWTPGRAGYMSDVFFSLDGTKVYATQELNSRLYRWDKTSLEMEWDIYVYHFASLFTAKPHPNIDGAVISSCGLDAGGLYPGYIGRYPTVFDSDGNVLGRWNMLGLGIYPAIRDMAVTSQYAYFAFTGASKVVLYQANLNDYTDFASWSPTPAEGYDEGVGWQVVTYNDFVYIYTSRVAGGNLWKLNSSLEVVASTAIGMTDLFVDYLGRICIKKSGADSSDIIVLSADDLSVIETVDSECPYNWVSLSIYNAVGIPTVISSGYKYEPLRS